MATKLKKMADKLNNDFREKLSDAASEKFGIEVETNYNFCMMQYVSSRKDGKKFTKQQHEWLGGYSEGYAAAMVMVRDDA